MSIDALLCIYGGLSNPFRFGTLNVGCVRGSYLFSSAGFGLAGREQHTESIIINPNTATFAWRNQDCDHYKLFLHV